MAWVAWQDGCNDDVVAKAEEALSLWNVSLFPSRFMWVCLWPLIGVRLQLGQVAGGIRGKANCLGPLSSGSRTSSGTPEGRRCRRGLGRQRKGRKGPCQRLGVGSGVALRLTILADLGRHGAFHGLVSALHIWRYGTRLGPATGRSVSGRLALERRPRAAISPCTSRSSRDQLAGLEPGAPRS